jgi:DNA-directed RNA polymerase subunit N (RpoN/RPB10)
MIIPIKCFGCGGFISDKWIKYTELVNTYRVQDGNINEIELLDADTLKSKTKYMTAECKALKDLDVHRICCRRHFLTNVDLIESI